MLGALTTVSIMSPMESKKWLISLLTPLDTSTKMFLAESIAVSFPIFWVLKVRGTATTRMMAIIIVVNPVWNRNRRSMR